MLRKEGYLARGLLIGSPAYRLREAIPLKSKFQRLVAYEHVGETNRRQCDMSSDKYLVGGDRAARASIRR